MVVGRVVVASAPAFFVGVGGGVVEGVVALVCTFWLVCDTHKIREVGRAGY